MPNILYHYLLPPNTYTAVIYYILLPTVLHILPTAYILPIRVLPTAYYQT